MGSNVTRFGRELKVSNALLYTDSKLIEDSMMQGKVKMLSLKFILKT